MLSQSRLTSLLVSIGGRKYYNLGGIPSLTFGGWRKISNTKTAFSERELSSLVFPARSSSKKFVIMTKVRDEDRKLKARRMTTRSNTATQSMSSKEYFLNYIRNHERHGIFIFDPSKRSHVVTDPIVKRFVDLAKSQKGLGSNVFEPEFYPTMCEVADNAAEMSKEDLLNVLYYFGYFEPFAPKKSNHKIYELIMRPIDKAVIAKMAVEWAHEDYYLPMGLFVQLGLINHAEFAYKFKMKLLRKVDRLSFEHIIWLCFILSCSKPLPCSQSLHNLQENVRRILSEHTDTVNMDDLAIMVMPFVKNKRSISGNEIIQLILHVIEKHKETASSKALSVAMLSLGVTNFKGNELALERALQSLRTEVSRLNVNAWASIGWIGLRGIVRCQPLLQDVASRLEEIPLKELEKIHYKDIEYLAWALGQFKIDSPKFFENISRVLQNKLDHTLEMDELAKKFNTNLHSMLNLLLLRRIFNKELMDIAFNKDFLGALYGDSMYSLNNHPGIRLLHENVIQDRPEYQLNMLNEKTRGYLLKANMIWVHDYRKNWHRKYARAVASCLEKQIGEPNMFLTNILPHQRTLDIVLCTNIQGLLIPIPKAFKLKTEYLPKDLSPQDIYCNECWETVSHIYHVIVMSSWDLVIYGSGEPLGELVQKQAQLSRLNYTVSEISERTWASLTGDEKKEKLLAIVEDIQTVKTDEWLEKNPIAYINDPRANSGDVYNTRSTVRQVCPHH